MTERNWKPCALLMEMENGMQIPQEIKNRTTICCCCCCCSTAKLCPTLCNPIDCTTYVPHHLPEFAQVHVCWLGDALSPSRITALLWWRGLHNSVKLWAMLCRATQDGRVIVRVPDKTWSIGGGNRKPPWYICCENPMNCIKRQKETTIWPSNSTSGYLPKRFESSFIELFVPPCSEQHSSK